MLVLTCDENKRTPSQYFRDIYDEIQSVNSDEFDLKEFSFQSVKKVNLKNSFSFTSHITVYETCALQYKFYKELEFMPVRQNAMMFGIWFMKLLKIFIELLSEEKLIKLLTIISILGLSRTIIP